MAAYDGSEKVVKTIVTALVVLFVLIIASIFFFAIVPAGHIGVQDTFGNVSDDQLAPGFHVKSPFTAVINMDVRTQKYVVTGSAASKDLQDVTTEVSVNFRLNGLMAKEVYKNIGYEYQDIVIVPATQEALKASTAQFTADEIITKRPEVKKQVEALLTEKLKIYNIVVETVSLTDFKFSPEFTAAIESKVTAEQQALEAKNVLERVKIEKEQTITQAEASNEARKLQADAEAYATKVQADSDAYALKVVREQLAQNEKLIDYTYASRWNGEMPTYYSTNGQNALPFINATQTATTN